MAEPFAPGPVRVNIEIHAIGDEDRAFVVPPSIEIGEGTKKVPSVQWRNATGQDAKFWFPNGEAVFSPPNDQKEGFANPIPIRSGEVLTLYVKPETKYGLYHYHVYCEATKNCAQGNSEPTVDCP
jgi:hypothetical protein